MSNPSSAAPSGVQTEKIEVARARIDPGFSFVAVVRGTRRAIVAPSGGVVNAPVGGLVLPRIRTAVPRGAAGYSWRGAGVGVADRRGAGGLGYDAAGVSGEEFAVRVSSVLIVLGLVLVALGVLLRFVPGAFAWFGRLPGDLHWERDGVRVFVPLTSMLVLSLLFSLLLHLFGRLR